MEEKAHWLSELINHETVDRTTPATPGLLKIRDVALVSTDSDKFEAVVLSALSFVLKIIMVNKKETHPLFFLWEKKKKKKSNDQWTIVCN